MKKENKDNKQIIEDKIKEELSQWNKDMSEFPEWFRIRCITFYELGKEDNVNCEKIRKFCNSFGRSNLVSKSQIQDILNDEVEDEEIEDLIN